MKNKYLILIILATLILFLLPELTFAGVEVKPGDFKKLFFLIISIPLFKALIFCFISRKFFKVKIKFFKIILVTILASVISVVLFFKSLTLLEALNLKIVGLFIFTFILLILIEWILYLIFFRRINIRIFNLLKISFIVNLLSTFVYPFFVFIAFDLFY